MVHFVFHNKNIQPHPPPPDPVSVVINSPFFVTSDKSRSSCFVPFLLDEREQQWAGRLATAGSRWPFRTVDAQPEITGYLFNMTRQIFSYFSDWEVMCSCKVFLFLLFPWVDGREVPFWARKKKKKKNNCCLDFKLEFSLWK